MSGRNLSRRRFLGVAGIAAGAVALGPTISACSGRSGSVYDALRNGSNSDRPIGFTSVALVGGVVLAASGGARIGTHRSMPNTVELVRFDDAVATYGNVGDPTAINHVSDAAFAPDGTIWLVDRGNRTLVHLDASLAPITIHASLGDTPLRSPSGVDTLSDGRLVVADTRTGVHLVTASSNSTSLRSTALVTVSDPDGSVPIVPVVVPRHVTVTPDDHIIVHDRSNGASPRILRFAPDGSPTADPVAIAGVTTALAVTPRGDVVTLDSSTHSITRTSTDGASTTFGLETTPSGAVALTTFVDRSDSLSTLGGVSNSSSKRYRIEGLAVDRSSGELVVGLPVLPHDIHVHWKGDVR